MVCSPEQSRLNGAKSKGAVTEKGKVISSRNTTKHGLLAKQPPLLVTEDLATFEGLMQGLINHYQPEDPVEHFLVQQIAMGMLKQYRLWTVEAAIANLEILKTQQLVKFPDHVVPPKISLGNCNDFEEDRIPLRTFLEKEKRILQQLIADLEYGFSQVADRGEVKTLVEFRQSLGQNYYREDRKAAVWHCQNELKEWLEQVWKGGKKGQINNFQEALSRVQQLLELAQQRIKTINQTLEEIESTECGIQRSLVTGKGMQQQDLFSRYQRNISRELYEALDKLEAIQQRKNQVSMGSFGQNSDPSTLVEADSFPSP